MKRFPLWPGWGRRGRKDPTRPKGGGKEGSTSGTLNGGGRGGPGSREEEKKTDSILHVRGKKRRGVKERSIMLLFKPPKLKRGEVLASSCRGGPEEKGGRLDLKKGEGSGSPSSSERGNPAVWAARGGEERSGLGKKGDGRTSSLSLQARPKEGEKRKVAIA